MNCKRILTIQDISCVGQCSLTVALPIISACGVETCVLPSAVLSTHTAGFVGYTFRDLTEDMPAIRRHWENEGIKFNALYTGYLGSEKQIEYVTDIFNATAADDCIKIVDPAMADNGKLYAGFAPTFPAEMLKLCTLADYVVPNITEACMMTGMEYKTEYDKDYIMSLINALCEKGVKNLIITGVSYEKATTGVVVWENGEYNYYAHRRLEKGSHGTGDIYASALTGALSRGKSAVDAARIAADFTLACMEYTQKNYPEHTYGTCFEPMLCRLDGMISQG